MGHMHLHVGDLDAARAFYVDLLGFEVMVGMPSALFLAAGGYHHHLGVNTWRGPGVGPAPAGTAGLREWTLVLDAEPLAALRERLAAAGLGDGDVVEDPWGIRLRLADAGAVRSRAVVATDKPSPYLLQLAKHFRHKLPVEFDERQATIPLAFGAVDLTAEDGRLVLDARAAEPGGLARVEAVIGSHLERFGRRDELAVTWAPRS